VDYHKETGSLDFIKHRQILWLLSYMFLLADIATDLTLTLTVAIIQRALVVRQYSGPLL